MTCSQWLNPDGPGAHWCGSAHKHTHTRSPNGLGDVTKGVDRGSADGLLVGLEQLQQLKADPHPLPGRYVLCSTIKDTTGARSH